MEKAKAPAKEPIEVCAEGEFKLTKFTSYNMELLESIPEERRKNGVKNQDLAGGELPVKVLQNLCHDPLGWDEKIPENVAREWEDWKKKLLLLKNIEIDRCLKPNCGFEDLVEVTLHDFSDASKLGYG